MQSVLINYCFICKVSLLFRALYAKCTYYLGRYMQSVHISVHRGPHEGAGVVIQLRVGAVDVHEPVLGHEWSRFKLQNDVSGAVGNTKCVGNGRVHIKPQVFSFTFGPRIFHSYGNPVLRHNIISLIVSTAHVIS